MVDACAKLAGVPACDAECCISRSLAQRSSSRYHRVMVLRRRWLMVAFAVMWIVSGPVAMAFNGCAAMAGMCEAPCGTGAPMVVAAESEPILLPVSTFVPATAGSCPSGVRRVVELPPRPASLSA
jgi:hypothetical protein